MIAQIQGQCRCQISAGAGAVQGNAGGIAADFGCVLGQPQIRLMAVHQLCGERQLTGGQPVFHRHHDAGRSLGNGNIAVVVNVQIAAHKAAAVDVQHNRRGLGGIGRGDHAQLQGGAFLHAGNLEILHGGALTQLVGLDLRLQLLHAHLAALVGSDIHFHMVFIAGVGIQFSYANLHCFFLFSFYDSQILSCQRQDHPVRHGTVWVSIGIVAKTSYNIKYILSSAFYNL